MQLITLDMGTMFQPVDNELRNAFLPSLFKRASSQILRIAVTGLPVNQAGIALPYLTQTSRYNWTDSCIIIEHLVAALCGTAEFWSGGHSLLMG